MSRLADVHLSEMKFGKLKDGHLKDGPQWSIPAQFPRVFKSAMNEE